MSIFYLLITVFVLSLSITVISETKLIPILKKRARQPIYESGPMWHMSKSGTPTMGGLAFILSSIVSLSVAAATLWFYNYSKASLSIIITLGFAILNALIGILDDTTKIMKSENAGLTPLQKLFFQFITASIFLTARNALLGDSTVLSVATWKIDLGFLYYPFAIFMILGIINCANLTDGIDGLASSVGFFIGIIFLILSSFTSLDGCFISVSLIAFCLGFLFFNAHPAKIFMGDTGSLFIGAITIGCAFAIENPLIVIFVGGIYVVEGVSVIMQVIYYKLTQRRLFKMAPIHHHLEKSGFSENKICIFAIIFTLLMSIPAFMILKP